MRIRVMMVAGVLIGALAAPVSEAAYVRPVVRDVWVYGSAEPIAVHDVVYDGEGQEANNVVVSADPTRTAVQFADPGIKMHTDPLQVPGLDGNTNPYATWQCVTPGSSVATCAATPGSHCTSLNCSFPGPSTFEGLLKVAGNSGNDRIVILPTKFESRVWGVFGDDVIEVANNSKDVVDCGSGVDQVVADPGDTIAANCESVTRR